MNRKGFTILEVFIATLATAILGVTLGNVFIVGFRAWDGEYNRASLKRELSQSLELIAKSLRQAKNIDSLSESSITFTADLGAGDQSCRVYLYNSSDAEPNPPYTQSTYSLRWAEGTVTYGSGANLSMNISQPTTAPFSQSGNVITIDLTAVKDNQTLRMRTKIRPRNL